MPEDRITDDGITFTSQEADTQPPLGGLEEGQAAEPTPQVGGGRITNKVPLHPAFIKVPLRGEGVALELLTGCPIWLWDEKDLEDLGELGADTGLMLSPMMQFLGTLIGGHLVKIGMYARWVKAGKPTIGKRAIAEAE